MPSILKVKRRKPKAFTANTKCSWKRQEKKIVFLPGYFSEQNDTAA
jgi:hypothetical protein